MLLISLPFLYTVSFILLDKGSSLLKVRSRAPSFAEKIRVVRTNMVQGVVVDDQNCIVNVNPATGELVSMTPCTTQDEIEKLVEQANVAQRSWSCVPLEERIALLQEGVRQLKLCRAALVNLISSEMGKPEAQAQDELDDVVNKEEWLNLVQTANEDETLTESSVVVRDPLGVVVVLSPWNFPADELLLLALPALAAGNTVIVKPSEVTPETGALVVSTLAALLPPHVLQLAQGDGRVGAWLVQSPHIHMVAMTGSSAVGKHIMTACATSLKRLVLELGGKDPMIVFSDADLDLAAADAVKYSLYNAGQVCCSVERIYVDDSIRSQFEQKVLHIASTQYHVIGPINNVNDDDPKKTQVGPLVSALQHNLVQGQVDDAVQQGATLLYQSEIPVSNPEQGSTTTHYFPITVLSNLKQTMIIQTQETFGPVVAISTFDGSEMDAIRLANDSEYGLSSSVYTRDLEKGKRVSRNIQSGQVGINCYPLEHANVACPWYVFLILHPIILGTQGHTWLCCSFTSLYSPKQF
eukprot:scaffold96297_cov53-Attheya_sp.AAC.4